MGSGAGRSPATSAWRDLVALAGRRDGDRAFLDRLLEVACERSGWKGAALYGEREGVLERSAWAGGERSFPARLDVADGAAAGAVELPGARLVIVSGEGGTAEPEESLLLALAAAHRAAQLQQRLKQQSFEVKYRGVELEALYDVGLAIASMLNLENLGEEILLRAVSLLDARRGALYLTAEGSYVLERTFGGDAEARMSLDDEQVLEVLRGRSPGDQRLLPGARHLMGAPIGSERQPRGLLLVADKESRRGVGPFGAGDRRTLSLFANQAAIALENADLHRQALEKERLERELELAADIQRRLLPIAIPEVDGYELMGWSRPARHVGGDYYDLLPAPGGGVMTVLADVSGKGMPAALMVSTIHSALRVLADRTPVGPELLARLNHHVFESSAPNKFVTMLAAQLDAASHELAWINAGHNPGLLFRAAGGVEELPPGGLPLGLFSGSKFEGGRLELGVGDLLCLYTDGITEACGPDDEEYGPERLVELVESQRESSLPALVKAIERTVTDFARGLSQGDDQTLVLLRRTG